MGISRPAALVALSAMVMVVTSTSCLDPTQITVDITTDVRCSDTKGTSIVGGAPGTVELASPTTTTRDCEDGRIGTLVSTPSGSKDVDAAFMIVMGVDRPVSECTAENHFLGCVVQRRLIHYIKHTPLTLPITMWLVCKDVECGPETTCAKSGKCVSARIPDPSACVSTPCLVDGDGPPFVPGSDGGPADGSPGDGDPADGPITDGPMVGDADADAPIVVDPPPQGNRLYCPNHPNNCDLPGGTCCFSHSGSGGRCTSPCGGNDITMRCNRKSDCPLPGDSCCGTIIDSLGANVLGASPNALDAALLDASVGTRTLTSTSCATTDAGSCAGAWICTQLSDCPAGYAVCDKTSALFNPTGTFGECKF